MGDRIVLVEHSEDGKMIGTVYHNISCLEDGGWVNGAMHGRAPIQGHFRALVLEDVPDDITECSHCRE